MNKSKKYIVAGAIAPFALAAIFLYPHKAPVISLSQVYTWDCEYPVQKPDAITLTCADGGIYIDKIDWSSWNATGARGTGTYNVNTCDPSCADGSYLRVKVDLTLSKLEKYKQRHFLRTLVIETKDGKNLPMLNSATFEWDVMEFAEVIREDL